ncbi:hypothetical protein G7Y89_g1922 [Cudoniella acicularis]|uniref:DHHA2 domain-containing protein n=1 Tax=Cudoniella acicularis TaxID=354080 RepID=A0A8H4RX87_9HELO|nr:hypothetical protein G7Y89_g1922 [Cudoniella acicularis]
MPLLRRASLRSFLSSAKALLANPTQQATPLTFIVGNESADLDSLCSTVVLAYLRTYSSKKDNGFYIPLSNLLRADLSLRPELLPVLKQANLKPSDLITLSDLPSQSSDPHTLMQELKPERTRWILVDHNVLLGELGKAYGENVVGVLDHHEDERIHVSSTEDAAGEGRVIRTCGSCASLVVEEWRRYRENNKNVGEGEEKQWDVEVGKVALAPVLVDTANLTSKEKITKTDVEAVAFLEGIVGREFDRKEYYDEISRAKEDIASLGLRDILRKDYKQWSEGRVELGISSVVKNMEFLVAKAGGKEGFLKVVQDWAIEKGLSLVAIMTTSHEGGKFGRELLVWGIDGKGAEALKKFEKGAGEKLGLQVWEGGL